MDNFVLKLITNFDQTDVSSSLHYKCLFDAGEFPKNHLKKFNHLHICVLLKYKIALMQTLSSENLASGIYMFH